MSTLRDVAREWLEAAVPDNKVITSDGDPKEFFALTKCTHEVLMQEWRAQVKKPRGQRAYKTTCNEFVGVYSKSTGLGNLALIDPHGQLKKDGQLQAWVPADGGKRPGCGDIVQHIMEDKHGTFAGFHVDVSLNLTGDAWTTVDGGQGGPQFGKDKEGNDIVTGGHDRIKRCHREFGKSKLVGWIDIERYFAIHNRVRPGLERAVGDLRNFWLREDGDLVHPRAPAGRGGPGGFSVPGAVALDWGDSGPWHPDAPADADHGSVDDRFLHDRSV